MLEFKNPRVARHYDATAEIDRMVHLPALYSGLLSNIGIAVARKLIEQKSNLLHMRDDCPDPGTEQENIIAPEVKEAGNKKEGEEGSSSAPDESEDSEVS